MLRRRKTFEWLDYKAWKSGNDEIFLLLLRFIDIRFLKVEDLVVECIAVKLLAPTDVFEGTRERLNEMPTVLCTVAHAHTSHITLH